MSSQNLSPTQFQGVLSEDQKDDLQQAHTAHTLAVLGRHER
jgi:hypothetical protein